MWISSARREVLTYESVPENLIPFKIQEKKQEIPVVGTLYFYRRGHGFDP